MLFFLSEGLRPGIQRKADGVMCSDCSYAKRCYRDPSIADREEPCRSFFTPKGTVRIREETFYLLIVAMGDAKSAEIIADSGKTGV